ncbi:hypothetical protein [Planomonospora parontospora]|uniref:hypothetical protein n=1 Tax=Planomonospora parontospora TaxID=58119 RepID=UPI00166FD6B7|nr:hypothetical protein [Planomonospora parontospora]GGL46397.1 hypothetical protein GCM10014719_54520 [Planomonospora parontospora subsp. antibiotica]GII16180.1 hypothetical protein Ppa05_29060 [Planomonospora parontospora subsp. antibiotica]
MDKFLERAGGLKAELSAFLHSGRYDRKLRALVAEVGHHSGETAELYFGLTLEGFMLSAKLPGGDTVVEQFIHSRRDLSAEDRDLLLSWRDNVQGIFEIKARDGDDGLVLFNHVDELTYTARSNMGAQGLAGLGPGMILIQRIVPLGQEWMMSGPGARFPADQAEQVLAGLPQLMAGHPEAVFRNPAKLAEARAMQDEQRQAFIELHGSDLVVVAGAEVRETLLAFYRHVYEKAGSKAGPWTDPGLQPLPEEWAHADSVAMIYDEIDGLGFYLDYALAQDAFADPDLVVRQPYRQIISGYLREDAVSPVPLQRLAAADPAKASLLFAKILKKRGFIWERDGEALLRRYKSDWYDNPPPPRITPVPGPMAERYRAAK